MRSCKVLLVDDEYMILEGYQQLFDWGSYGCEICGTAMDGEEAIQKAEETKPDVVIMDINLPKLNGLEALGRILEEAQDRTVYSIIVTGYDEFDYCRAALRLRVVDFLLKPIDFDALGKVLQGIMEKFAEDHKEEEPPVSNTMKTLICWIQEHLGEEIHLTPLAEQMNLNASYISQLFKKELGVGFHAYVNQIRIEKAKEYLIQTNDTITEIAGKVGFQDYRVFTKVFKSVAGELPSKYRKK